MIRTTTTAAVLLLLTIVPTLTVPASAALLDVGSHTVVCFGDSTTAPRGDLYIYPDILRDELPSWGITGGVINSGVGGDTTARARNRFESAVRSYDPDLVIVQFGINDSAVDDPGGTPRVDLATYTNNITYFVQTLKNDGAQVVLMTPNPLRWTDTLIDYYGHDPYDVNDPMGFNTTLYGYADAVRLIAQSENVPLIDVFQNYVDYDAVPGQTMDDLLLDGMHPNTAGQRMTGDALVELITDGLPPYEPPVHQAFADSANFGYKYEADAALPTVEDSGAGKTNWTFFDHASVDAGFEVSDGVLSYSTMAYSTGGEWFYSNTAVPDSAWVNQVSSSTSYAVEFRTKVTGGKGNVPGLHFIVDNGAERLWINIDTDHVAIGSGGAETRVLADGLDNASEFHDYRLTFDATTGKYQLWRDDERIGADFDAPLSSVGKYLGFGDATSQGFGAAEIDYIRWDPTDAYAPEFLIADLDQDGFIGSGDLDAVRANWGQDVDGRELGDASGDGKVDSEDLDLIRANWGRGVQSPASVPEPGTAVLTFLGCVLLSTRRPRGRLVPRL